MSATQTPIYAAPFDAVAQLYDDSFTLSQVGRAQRAAVWRVLEKTFQSGNGILEIGCGTGVDACFLAERGVRVLACDSSSQMIEIAARRVLEKKLQRLVQPLALAAEELSSLPGEATFDGAFSNFGPLNCINNIQRFARDLGVRVKPGGIALLCWIGPFCLWETVWYLALGNRRKAFRRLNRDGVSARIGDGAFVQVHYPTVRQIATIFAPEFRLKSIRGIGVAIPPSYVEKWVERHPRTFHLFQKADTLLGRCPGVRLLADHVLVSLQREDLNAGIKPGAGKP